MSWELYFSANEYQPSDRRALLIRDMAAFFGTEVGWQLLTRSFCNDYDNRYHCSLDYEQLLAATRSADLTVALEMAPAEGLACLSAAATECFCYAKREAAASLLQRSPPPGKVAIRLTNHSPSLVLIKQLKSSSIGKLATVKGTVVRSSHVRPLVVEMDFACGK